MSRRPKTISRRRLLATGGALAGATAAFGFIPRAFAGPGASAGRGAETGSAAGARHLTLKNLHTPEVLDVVYRRGDNPRPRHSHIGDGL